MLKLLTLSLTLTPLFSYANQNLNPPKPLSPSDYVVRNNYDHAISIIGIGAGKCLNLTATDGIHLKLPLVIESGKRQKMFLRYDNQGKCGNSTKTIGFTLNDSKRGETTDFKFYRKPSKLNNHMIGWQVYVTSFSANTPVNATVACFVVENNDVKLKPGIEEDCLYPKTVALKPATKINIRISLDN